jgi:thiol-disulfide isomerase/thioredoxin
MLTILSHMSPMPVLNDDNTPTERSAKTDIRSTNSTKVWPDWALFFVVFEVFIIFSIIHKRIIKGIFLKYTVGIFSFLLLVLIALAGQDYFNIVQISAVPSKKETKIQSHYQSLYSSKEFKTVKGKTFKLPEEKKPIVIVNFWASWCKPCVKEFADLNTLVSKYEDKILILGINTDDEDQAKHIKKMTKKHKLNFPIVADKNSKLVDEFIVDSIPFSVIYLNGKLHKYHVGIQDFVSGQYIELFDKAIAKGKSQSKK